MKKSIKIILIIRHVNGEEVDWDSLSEGETPILLHQNSLNSDEVVGNLKISTKKITEF